MTTDTKVAELPAKWRAWAKRIRGITAGSDFAADIMEGSAEDLEAALARQEAASSSVAPPALYQHDDGRYALALGDVARHKLTDGHPEWHRVPLNVIETCAAPPAAQAVDLEQVRLALSSAEAALADIGDADREPGDDVAWCERRAALALPSTRAALALIDQQAGKGVDRA